MKGRVVAGLVLLGGLVTVFVVTNPDTDHDGQAETPATSTPDFAPGAPTTCLPCHASVYAEWSASMHSQAYLDPQVRAPNQADNFRKIECLPCHAPRSVFDRVSFAENWRIMLAWLLALSATLFPLGVLLQIGPAAGLGGILSLLGSAGMVLGLLATAYGLIKNPA